MQTRQRHLGEDAAKTHILGPCPGCGDWQLDYTDQVAEQFCTLSWTDGVPQISTVEFHRVVEFIFQEHAADCPRLRDLTRARSEH